MSLSFKEPVNYTDVLLNNNIKAEIYSFLGLDIVEISIALPIKRLSIRWDVFKGTNYWKYVSDVISVSVSSLKCYTKWNYQIGTYKDTIIISGTVVGEEKCLPEYEQSLQHLTSVVGGKVG